jgi:hypothetical protein
LPPPEIEKNRKGKENNRSVEKQIQNREEKKKKSKNNLDINGLKSNACISVSCLQVTAGEERKKGGSYYGSLLLLGFRSGS